MQVTIETKKAPLLVVQNLFARLSHLAGVIEQGVKLLPGCGVHWDVKFQSAEVGHSWRALCEVSQRKMMQVAYDAGNCAHEYVAVPVIVVGDIVISQQSDDVYWGEKIKEVDWNDPTMRLLLEALSTGRLGGKNFVVNSFPAVSVD